MKILKKLRKERKITQDKLSQAMGVSRSTISMWEINSSEPDNETICRLADYFNVSADYLIGHSDKQTAIPGDIPYPIMLMPDPVSAGLGEILTDGHEFTWINAENAPKGASFALRVRGDSMEPNYCDGDIVYVKMKVYMESGDIGVFILNNEGYLKQLRGGKLVSLNSAYEPIVIGEFDEFIPVGRVIGVYRP